MTARPRRRLAGRSWIPAGLLAAYLLIFLALPLGTMLKAVLVGQGGWRLGEAIAVFGYPLTGYLSSTGNLTTGLVSSLTGLVFW